MVTIIKVFIDAGHNYSSFDTGAKGHGLREQTVNYAVARRLSEILESTGVATRLSQSSETENIGRNISSSVSLRAKMANDWKADYFVSIHCNYADPQTHGTETLIASRGGRAEQLAICVQRRIVARMHTVDRGVKVRADLGVLRLANMPAIVVELAFISHKDDAELLRTRTGDFALSICEGILKMIN